MAVESKPLQEPGSVKQTFGAGVHYFDGRVPCPLAGVGSRGPNESNRIALDDDDTAVTVDRETAQITIVHKKRTRTKTIIADLMFLAIGSAAGSGRQIPFGIHLKVFKTGNKISTDFHRHMRTQDELTDAEFEPFTVVVTDGSHAEVVLDPASVLGLIRKPSRLHLLIKSMMAMRNHVDGIRQDRASPGYCLADLSMGFGRGRLAWMMTRAKLESLSSDNAKLIDGGSLVNMLAEGAWRLEIRAFTDKYLPKVIARDLFLFGLGGSKLLAPVLERGLAANQSLAFRFEKGSGAIEFDGREEPLENAVDVARAYLEYHMLGGLLIEETEKRFLE